MEYKTLALDLDGTLTNSEKKVSEENVQAVARAIEKDKVVILASGRPELGIVPIAKKLNLYELGGYILAYNGGRIVDCKTRKVLREITLPMDRYPEIYRIVKQFGAEIITYSDHEVLTENPESWYVQRELFCCGCGFQKTEYLLDAVKEPVIKFLALGPHEMLLPLKDYLNENCGEFLSAYFSEPYFLEIIANGIEKADGLRFLNETLGHTREEMIACGDGFNDIPMLQYAGLSVVMDNATEEIKQYGDYIAPSNDENGVAHVIRKFL